jgi:enoyl-CoA hydratase
LVNRLTEPAGALAGALELADEIRVHAPLALATSKRIIVESSDWPTDEAFVRQRPLVTAVEGSTDAREGALAFVEKRAPNWTGR